MQMPYHLDQTKIYVANKILLDENRKSPTSMTDLV